MVDGKPTLPEVLQVNKITCSVRPCCDMNNLTIILVYQSKFLNNINVLDTIELPAFSGDLVHFIWLPIDLASSLEKTGFSISLILM